ncbi:transcription termination factor 3, mitochondrial [Prorops nasuta]|uniref:transcription termination factor 3, mitochondrial n=1 Tax=Prorops nasuta TaxID=863751 RepID=UPI0034CE1261
MAHQRVLSITRLLNLSLSAKTPCVSKIHSLNNKQLNTGQQNNEIDKANENCIKTRDSDISITNSFQKLCLNLNNDDSDIDIFNMPIKLPSALDKCDEDVSDIGPYYTSTFNIAKYADISTTIQKLVDLGVKLYKYDHTNIMNHLLNSDFDRDIKPYIKFLVDCGLPLDSLGEYISKCPFIFKEDLDDLHTRIRYLRAHNFSIDMIKVILSKNPGWIIFPTKFIDKRLGFFQKRFKLNGYQVRKVTVRHPKLITFKMEHIEISTFSIKEEMGFTPEETKSLLLTKPRIWTKNKERVLKTFDYAHNVIKIPHILIVREPEILMCRKDRLEGRHKFLIELKRDQFDPFKPLYISPKKLVEGSDAEFCENVAHTTLDIYNEFLKTL